MRNILKKAEETDENKRIYNVSEKKHCDDDFGERGDLYVDVATEMKHMSRI